MEKFIHINDNSKGGPCCSASVDITIGCDNMCIGCYGLKSSRLGKNFHTESPKVKVFNESIFRKDCKKYRNKGVKHIRFGKFSDPGRLLYNGTLNSVIKTAGEENLRFVLTSKSIAYNKEISELMKNFNHTLHISLGMISRAIDDEYRVRNFKLFNRFGINSKIRIIEDITRKIPEKYFKIIKKINHNNIIITPIRFSSKTYAEIYDANLTNYIWKDGFYRPTMMHPSWEIFQNWCGSTYDSDNKEDVKCCNCLVNQE